MNEVATGRSTGNSDDFFSLIFNVFSVIPKEVGKSGPGNRHEKTTNEFRNNLKRPRNLPTYTSINEGTCFQSHSVPLGWINI